jgi:colicin import membrane protein
MPRWRHITILVICSVAIALAQDVHTESIEIEDDSHVAAGAARPGAKERAQNPFEAAAAAQNNKDLEPELVSELKAAMSQMVGMNDSERAKAKQEELAERQQDKAADIAADAERVAAEAAAEAAALNAAALAAEKRALDDAEQAETLRAAAQAAKAKADAKAAAEAMEAAAKRFEGLKKLEQELESKARAAAARSASHSAGGSDAPLTGSAGRKGVHSTDSSSSSNTGHVSTAEMDAALQRIAVLEAQLRVLMREQADNDEQTSLLEVLGDRIKK